MQPFDPGFAGAGAGAGAGRGAASRFGLVWRGVSAPGASGGASAGVEEVSVDLGLSTRSPGGGKARPGRVPHWA
jgi:hypothetical protein